MDDPELALEQAVEKLTDSSASDSEVGSESLVESSVEMFHGGPRPTVNKEQAFALYRHLLMQPQPRGNHLNSLQNSVSGSEDNSSIASFESDAGAKSAVYCHQARNAATTARLAVSDTEGSRTRRKSSRRGGHHDPYLSEGHPISINEFFMRTRERLLAVSKDRDAMTLKARDLLRQQGKSYEEIMSAEWYMLPEAHKYLEVEDTDTPVSNGTLHPPPSSHHMLSPLEVRSPDPNSQGQLATPQGSHKQGMPMTDVEEAIRAWHLTNQQVQRKRHSQRRQTNSGCSSVFSATSDSGVGGDTWAANDMTTPANTDRLQAYVHTQNMFASRLPERDRTAQAAAIALISNSPHPESLNPVPGQNHPDNERHHRRPVGPYSSDDSSSVFTITSQSSTSDLFIPRRAQNHPLYAADSDDQQHYNRRRPLAMPRSSRSSHLRSNHTQSPLADQHRQIPLPQTQRPTSTHTRGDTHNTLVMYTLGELTTPFAKRLSGSELTLKDFKERVFARKGDYRFFFKSFCPDVNMELFEEFSDDLSLLPLVDGKIVGRVEKLPLD